jgi:hypothetical protein
LVTTGAQAVAADPPPPEDGGGGGRPWQPQTQAIRGRRSGRRSRRSHTGRNSCCSRSSAQRSWTMSTTPSRYCGEAIGSTTRPCTGPGDRRARTTCLWPHGSDRSAAQQRTSAKPSTRSRLAASHSHPRNRRPAFTDTAAKRPARGRAPHEAPATMIQTRQAPVRVDPAHQTGSPTAQLHSPLTGKRTSAHSGARIRTPAWRP